MGLINFTGIDLKDKNIQAILLAAVVCIAAAILGGFGVISGAVAWGAIVLAIGAAAKKVFGINIFEGLKNLKNKNK